MANNSIKVEMTRLNIFKGILTVVNDITKDERIPVQVREEIIDKVNLIIESQMDA
jgi:hypothetical protein